MFIDQEKQPPCPPLKVKEGEQGGGRSICLNSKQDTTGRGLHGDLSNGGTCVRAHLAPGHTAHAPCSPPTSPAAGLRVTPQLQAELLGLAQNHTPRAMPGGRAHAPPLHPSWALINPQF